MQLKTVPPALSGTKHKPRDVRKAWPSLLEQEKGASPRDSRLGAATQRAGEHLDGVTGAAHGSQRACVRQGL